MALYGLIILNHSYSAFTLVRVQVRAPVYTDSSKHEFACIPMVTVHIDTGSVRVRVTCEFHFYEQFLSRSCFYATRTMLTTQNLY